MIKVFATALAISMIAGAAAAIAKIIPDNWKPCADAANGFVYEHTTNFDGKPIVIMRNQIPAWARAPASFCSPITAYATQSFIVSFCAFQAGKITMTKLPHGSKFVQPMSLQDDRSRIHL